MFHSMAYAFIDAIQNSKKEFVSTFITNDKVAKVLVNFVDSQTQYTKSAVDTGIKTITELSKVTTSKDFFSGK